MIVRLTTLILLLTVFSCSKSSTKSKFATDTQTSGFGSDSTSGTQFRLADAKSLQTIYERVFYKRNIGTEQESWTLACDNRNNYKWCKQNMFSAGESKELGTLDLEGKVNNFQTQKNLTLNYIKYIRAALSRECLFLVNTEWDAEDKEENGLIKRQGSPLAVDIDEFFKKLTGINKLDVKTNFDADEYANAFIESVGDKNPVNNAKDYKDAYLATCIAVSMDPLILMY